MIKVIKVLIEFIFLLFNIDLLKVKKYPFNLFLLSLITFNNDKFISIPKLILNNIFKSIILFLVIIPIKKILSISFISFK